MRYLLLFLGAAAASTVMHERRDESHSRWVKRDAADNNEHVSVHVALKQRNTHNGLDYLMEVSDPSSPKYGKYYTPDDIVKLFAPDETTINKVKRWIVESGIDQDDILLPRSKSWLRFNSTVGQLESMLQTKYHLYDHVATKREYLASDDYSLPGDISALVDFIAPGVIPTERLGAKKKLSRRALATNDYRKKASKPIPSHVLDHKSDNQYCASYVSPDCIKAMYNISEGKLADKSNRLGVFGTDDDIFSQDDLSHFYGLFDTKIPPTFGPSVDLINWGNDKPSTPYGEATLDVTMSIPILYPQNVEFYEAKHNLVLGFLNQFLDAIDGSYCTYSSHGETGDDPAVDGVTPNEMCGAYKPTNVISFSYAHLENDFPAGYLQRQCEEFMKLGLQGVTVVFASGDEGVNGNHGGGCSGNQSTIFGAVAPASCPYVTSVGGTTLPNGSYPGDAEIASVGFSSGGGFSNIWEAPSYQHDAVSTFFAKHDPVFPHYSSSDGKIPTSGGIYNRAGRGYPDVAAVGENGMWVFNGTARGDALGTSMATPIVASIFTRINEELIAAGKPLIGFANPALYKNPAMFNDVTVGGQSESNHGTCAGKGFKAAPGWDPVTGLGTPRYHAMLEYFLGL